MNTTMQRKTPLLEKVLKLRYLLPLLALGYVVLGGFVVPRVDTAVGHVIMAVLAAVSCVVVIFGFIRYDNVYRTDSRQTLIFGITVSAVLYLLAAIVAHIILAMSGSMDRFWVYMPEGFLVAVAIVAVLIIAKEEQ